jgi:hypothetical protein
LAQQLVPPKMANRARKPRIERRPVRVPALRLYRPPRTGVFVPPLPPYITLDAQPIKAYATKIEQFFGGTGIEIITAYATAAEVFYGVLT